MQLREGLTEITCELEEAARKSGQRVYREVAGSDEAWSSRRRKLDIAEEVRQGVLIGLRELNSALEKAVERLQDEKPAQDDEA